MIKTEVDQADLRTVYGRVAENVALAPYDVPTSRECESCTDSGCQACYKCCPCIRCDKARVFKDLLVCPRCGCRVWYTACAPFTCICRKDCDCACCLGCDRDMIAELDDVLKTLPAEDAIPDAVLLSPSMRRDISRLSNLDAFGPKARIAFALEFAARVVRGFREMGDVLDCVASNASRSVLSRVPHECDWQPFPEGAHIVCVHSRMCEWEYPRDTVRKCRICGDQACPVHRGEDGNEEKWKE